MMTNTKYKECSEATKHPELSEKSVGKKVRICTGKYEGWTTVNNIYITTDMIGLDGYEAKIISFNDSTIYKGFGISIGNGSRNYPAPCLEIIEEDQQPEDNTIPTEIYVFQNIVETLSKISGISKEVTKPEDVLIEIKKASPGLVGREVVCRWAVGKGRVVKCSSEEYVWVKFKHNDFPAIYYIRNLWLVG